MKNFFGRIKLTRWATPMAEPEILELYDGTRVTLEWERWRRDVEKYGNAGISKPDIRFGIGFCPICENIFIKSNARQKYCSTDCQKKAKNKKTREGRYFSLHELNFLLDYFVRHGKMSPQQFEKYLARAERMVKQKERERKKKYGETFPPIKPRMQLETIKAKYRIWLENQRKNVEKQAESQKQA